MIPKLKANWWALIKKAWSIRLMALAFIFTVLETAMPYLQGWLPVPDMLFGTLSGLCVAGGFVARLLVQNDIAG